MYCDRCPGRAVGALILESGGTLDLCGHHMRFVVGVLEQHGTTYKIVYRTATV